MDHKATLKLIEYNSKIDIYLVSDTHLEFYYNLQLYDSIKIENFIELPEINNNKKNILCLCGDIGNPELKTYKDFIKYYSKFFNQTIIIAGNHEFYKFQTYKLDYESRIQKIRDIVSDINNVKFLYQDSFKYEEIVFIGVVLWSDLGNDLEILDTVLCFDKINFKNNKLISFYDYQQLHIDDKEKLIMKLEENKDKNIIVLSHHLPSFQLINEKYKNDKNNIFFATDLEYLFYTYNIEYWFCGHTHYKTNKKINNTEIIIHPFGYPNETGNCIQ